MTVTEKEKFNIIKPLPPNWRKDEKVVPNLKEQYFENVDWNSIRFSTKSNIKATKNKENMVLLNFQYDKTLKSIYNDIFGFCRKVFDFFAVRTPDFSAYRNIEPCQVEENVPQFMVWRLISIFRG